MNRQPKAFADLIVTFRWKWEASKGRWGRLKVYDQSSDYQSGQPATAWFTWQPQFGLYLFHLSLEGMNLPAWCGANHYELARKMKDDAHWKHWVMTFPNGDSMFRAMMGRVETKVAAFLTGGSR
jgi:hypothetical protein